MILDDLTLHNFGVYGGRQSITLTPTGSGRPIILFGGLNGGGKTTLLDALQLCLYGPAARNSNRNGLGYEEYLRRCIHRGGGPREAAIEVAFRHTANGEEQRFRLHRSWIAGNTGCRERFHVLRNGELDKLATDHWAEQVEDFIPARIAHLFLFDGEKVESYADLDGAPTMIATAIQNLLGLDIVERLIADLGLLERRRRTEMKAPEGRGEIEDLRAKIEGLEGARQRLVRERAAAANALDRRMQELAAIEERYQREGGGLFESRAELEGEAVANERQLATVLKELRDCAAGCAPLLLISDLLEAVTHRHAAEEITRRSRETVLAIAEEHKVLLAFPGLAALAPGDRRSLERELSNRLQGLRAAAEGVTYLDLGAEAGITLSSLSASDLPVTKARLEDLRASEQGFATALDEARLALAAAPSYDAIAGVLAAREAAQRDVGRLQAEQNERDSEIHRLEREMGQLREREARLAQAQIRERFEREDIRRLLLHSGKARGTLGRFRETVVERHVARIQRLVLESFHQLIRKRSLVTELRIDPQSFELELRGSDGHQLMPDRLSAGERQLLAIAILWGLAKASGRPLPTVIDTPLGRLDSKHRTHLVKRYFPQASHQVLLLSTDEEIIGRYYDDLRPSIDRTYRLRFDESEGRTIVESGYLAAGGEHGHAD
ncbi:MAG TPA: DNA sulfur modification protein DndD [Stellaceae bacterium]|jgi:DNA sulfur modification protein DndD|nr:DNA sulfur modification protein DndD [Stellaceae bacterium]